VSKQEDLSRNLDPVLVHFVRAARVSEAAAALEAIIADHTLPLLEQVIALKVGFLTGPEAEAKGEIEGDAIAGLIARLWKCRDDPVAKPIANWGGYIRRTASNTFDGYLRRRCPKWFRVKSKLRYLLHHREEFGLWTTTGGEQCGLASWHGRRDISPQYARLLEEPPPITVERPPDGLRADGGQLFTVVQQIFAWGNGPLQLDQLVRIIVKVWAIKEETPASTDDPRISASIARISATESDTDLTRSDNVGKLRMLWAGICALPKNQRAALLLNMREEHGMNALALFPFAAVVSIRNMAKVLGIEPAEFADLWPNLPLGDASIAIRLQVTRQQVINLRKAARARLKRFMKRDEQGRG
jgi:hypothetical protein